MAFYSLGGARDKAFGNAEKRLAGLLVLMPGIWESIGVIFLNDYGLGIDFYVNTSESLNRRIGISASLFYEARLSLSAVGMSRNLGISESLVTCRIFPFQKLIAIVKCGAVRHLPHNKLSFRNLFRKLMTRLRSPLDLIDIFYFRNESLLCGR